MMKKKLNQSFLVRDNVFKVFRVAPTSVELLINNPPLLILAREPADLFPSLLKSMSNAIDVPIFRGRFLQSDMEKRALKLKTSLGVAVDTTHVSHFRESIWLLSRACSVAPAYFTSKSTECRKC